MPDFGIFIVLGVVAIAGALIYIKKRKDDDDDDDNYVPITPSEEENMDTKFALVVGINKYATPGMDLSGCVNDATNMREFLVECCGFKAANVKMLTDSQATKKNILSHLNWLVSGRKAGDELFYYHSGHGTQVLDVSGDEADQLDEVLVTHDFDWNNPLLDDDIAKIFNNLSAGAFLSMMCDTCHSGSMSRNIDRNIAMPKEMAEKIKGKDVKKRKFGSRATQNHVMLSGCRDDQTSSETLIAGKRQGVLTYNFVNECRKSARSWTNIHADVTKILSSSGWSQDPVLSGPDNLKNRVVLGRKLGEVC
jgi:hypothetical protein